MWVLCLEPPPPIGPLLPEQPPFSNLPQHKIYFQHKSKSKSAIHYPGRKFKTHCKLWPKAILEGHKAYQWYTLKPTQIQ